MIEELNPQDGGSSPPAAAPGRAHGPGVKAQRGHCQVPGGGGGIGTAGVQPAWLVGEGTVTKRGWFLWVSNSFGVSYVEGEGGEQRASTFSPGG